jgi:D-alanyl-D-alanine dipeptidase
MWNVCPNPNFLTNPLKGSNHNRGVAVDLTICTPDGNNLDMGTDFDHEGFAAYTTNTDLPEQVLKNRLILSDNLNRFGFSKIRTEWWHFSDRNYISASSICDFIPKEYIEF